MLAVQRDMDFDGVTYESKFDRSRLNSQLRRVWDVMKDGAWMTPNELISATGCGTAASITARVRDFRKPEFGKFTVNRRRRNVPEKGIFEYQLVVPPDVD